MKKLIALLMVIAMVACLFAGCGETDKQGSDAVSYTHLDVYKRQVWG